AIALQLVRTIGHRLQFLEDETRHDQLGVDEPRITNIGNAAVDDDARVQDQRSGPLDLFGEFHVGNDEAKFVLGLQEHGNGNVATNQGDQHAACLDQLRVTVLERLANQGLQGGPEQRAEQEPHQQAKVDGRDGRDLLALDGDVKGDDHETQKEDTGKDGQSDLKLLDRVKIEQDG